MRFNSLIIKPTNQFKRDFKKISKQGKNLKLLQDIINDLANFKSLDKKYCDHALKGEFKNYRECHISPDWLLMYKHEGSNLVLVRTGSHSDLFHT